MVLVTEIIQSAHFSYDVVVLLSSNVQTFQNQNRKYLKILK